MNGSTFTWILVAFPAYLILSGRFTSYLKLAGSKEGAANE